MCRWQMLYYIACHLFHRKYWRLSTESLVSLFTILFEIFENRRSASNSRRQDSDYKTESWEELSSPWGLSTLVNYHDVCLEAWGASTYYLQMSWSVRSGETNSQLRSVVVTKLDVTVQTKSCGLLTCPVTHYRSDATEGACWNITSCTVRNPGSLSCTYAAHVWTIKRWPC